MAAPSAPPQDAQTPDIVWIRKVKSHGTGHPQNRPAAVSFGHCHHNHIDESERMVAANGSVAPCQPMGSDMECGADGARLRSGGPHVGGVKIIGATLTPNKGSTFPGFFTPENEVKRQTVNQWIRTSGAYDGVIDFDKAVRDPSDPARLLPAYASDDNTHLSDAGYQAMANAIDLSLFR
ncbi:MAG TPA: SGNH/GDSL hydrolase family protein [Steroidobacteraceae bacterium]|nr:SGNH/GDSL hydrolase family protein [Steroidobacteraceae bacterium]